MTNKIDQSESKISQILIAAVIVIYNQKIEESISFQSVDRNKAWILPIIVDNSTNSEIRDSNQDFSQKNQLRYHAMETNLGISKAYNLAIDEINHSAQGFKFVITLDQDTLLSEDYFNEIHMIEKYPITALVHCPKVVTSKTLLSPLPLNGSLRKKLNDAVSSGPILTAINSGLVWNIDAFRQVRFEERLFLDLVDFDIFFQLHKLRKNDQIHYMNCTIEQTFSGETFSSLESDLKRFKIYIHDFNFFCAKWEISRLYCFYVKLKRCLRLSMGHRSLSFMGALVSHYRSNKL